MPSSASPPTPGPALAHAQLGRLHALLTLPPAVPPPLQEHFHIGIYTSASRKTVDTALQLLEAAAGEA